MNYMWDDPAIQEQTPIVTNPDDYKHYPIKSGFENKDGVITYPGLCGATHVTDTNKYNGAVPDLRPLCPACLYLADQ